MEPRITAADFVAFLESKLAEWEVDVALGDTDAAAIVESFRKILGPIRSPKPKPRPGRPTLIYSRKAPLERAGGHDGEAY
jgi:hypothetical protein